MQVRECATLPKSRNILRIISVAMLLAAAMTVFAWGNLAGIVSAHAHLKSATVGPNAVVSQAPSTITLVFGEQSDLTQTVIQVLDANGNSVASGNATPKAGDATTWTINLKSGLSNGTYTVKYHTLTDDDGGIVDGSYTFKVDSTSAVAVGSSTNNNNEQETGGDAAPSSAPATGDGGAIVAANSASSLSLVTWPVVILLVASALLVLRRKYRH